MRFSTEYHTCSYSLGQFGEPWNCSCYLSSEIPQKKRWLSLRKYSNDAFIIVCSYLKNNAISTGGIIIKATKKGWKSGWQIINGATQNILSHPQTSYQDWDILEALDTKGKMTNFWWAFSFNATSFSSLGFYCSSSSFPTTRAMPCFTFLTMLFLPLLQLSRVSWTDLPGWSLASCLTNMASR